MARNCWEVKSCGRELNGNKVAELGVCPAAVDANASGTNNGKNGGRACWMITGTFCGGKVQGTYAEKLSSCMNCDFFKAVRDEEGAGFKLV